MCLSGTSCRVTIAENYIWAYFPATELQQYHHQQAASRHWILSHLLLTRSEYLGLLLTGLCHKILQLL